MKAFRYRISPTPTQEKALNATLTTCRFLYNDALAQRIEKYKTEKKSLSYADQCEWLAENKNEYQKVVHSQVLQSTLKRLDTSFRRFFDGLKKKKRVGFPRFKNEQRFKSFCYPQTGFRLTNDNRRITLSKIGNIRIKYSRPVEGKIKTCQVLKDVDQWFVILTCETEVVKMPESTKPDVGVDVGIKTFAYLSDGNKIENPRTLLKAEKKLHREQRHLSGLEKGKNNRRRQRIIVAKVHRKIRRQRDDFLHKTSTWLANNYGGIAFEDLNISGMLKNHCLAKHIADASWNKLVNMTSYKAENAGGRVALVDPRGTSQRCSGCGERVPKTLADRIHCCPHCGLVMDRDENAALNIKKLNTAGSAEIYACGSNVRPVGTSVSVGSC
jgi:putative transposase